MAQIAAEYTNRPLTEEEKVFAEEHHDMIYHYLKLHELPVDPWYDILIIPYLQAVKKYHTYEHLRKLKFEQVFFRTLDNGRSNYWRDINRKKRCPENGFISLDYVLESKDSLNSEFSIDVYTVDKKVDIEKQIIEKELLNLVYQSIEQFDNSEVIKRILQFKVEGYSTPEIVGLIREIMPGYSDHRITQTIREICRKQSKTYVFIHNIIDNC